MRLRFRPTRRQGIAIGASAVAVLVPALAFGPVVRARVAREAERRHLEVDVRGVRPGWFAVRLLDVHLRPDGVPGVDAHLGEVRIDLGLFGQVRAVHALGGEVMLDGEPEALWDSFKAWRGHTSEKEATAPRRSLPVALRGLGFHWRADKFGRVDIFGANVVRDAEGIRFDAPLARVEHGNLSATMTGTHAALAPDGTIRSAETIALVLEWSQDADPSRAALAASRSSATASLLPPPPPVDVSTPAKNKSGKKAPHVVTATVPAADAATPLIPLPHLRALRREASVAAAALAARLPDGAGVDVRALTIRWQKDGVPLSLGPGALSLVHRGERFELSFSTRSAKADGDPGAGGASPDEGAPLELRVSFPPGTGDLSASLEGGPVSLALLGVQEGAMGLTDVEHATVAGKGHLVLDAAGQTLTFGGDVQLRGLAVNQPRLAPDVVRGVDLGLRAAGVLRDSGELRLDNLETLVGAIHLRATGELTQAPDHVAASLRFEMPSASCQSLFDSVPSALLPTLRGTRFSGTFGARGRVAFDSRFLDDLVLEYDVEDRCRFVSVPDLLARERFTRPFVHRIYLPDGTIGEETTGPGTSKWTELGAISPYMEVAVLTTEDGGFRHHRGFNHKAIRSSIIANLKARRFVRGASTITMQLAKNLFLTRDKNLARKLEEVILADYLEQTFTKDEMMELYLNIIEFGPNVYGIGAAADHYFGRPPRELNLAECLFLSSMLPAPIRYHRVRDRGELPESWQRSIHNLMAIARKVGLITDQELEEGTNQQVVFYTAGQRPSPRTQHYRGVELDDSEWRQSN